MSLESPNYYNSDQATAMRYDIKDAAKHLGIAPSTLRYWENEGLVLPERNRENEYRQYSLHNLIDASEIAFYRQLGVPIKELKNYHGFTIGELDETLARTEESIDLRIAELAASRERLAKQRALNAQAEALRSFDMRPRTPGFQRIVAIEYDSPRHWILLVDEPWRYGLYIDASDPDTALEGLAEGSAAHADADVRPETTRVGNAPAKGPSSGGFANESASGEPIAPNEPGSVLWEQREQGHRQPSLECLLRVAAHGSASNARELFSKASRRGVDPAAIVATYLVTGTETPGGPRWDYYHAWVVSSSTPR